MFQDLCWSDDRTNFLLRICSVCRKRVVHVSCGRWLQEHVALDLGRRIPHQNGRNLSAGTP